MEEIKKTFLTLNKEYEEDLRGILEEIRSEAVEEKKEYLKTKKQESLTRMDELIELAGDVGMKLTGSITYGGRYIYQELKKIEREGKNG